MKVQKVTKVENFKEENRNFDIEKLLLRSSDCIFAFSGAYKNENGDLVLVDRENADAEICMYSDMESGKSIKVPAAYSKLFEEANHVINFGEMINNSKNNSEYKKQECKKYIRTISSSR